MNSLGPICRAILIINELLTTNSEVLMANEWILDVIEDLRTFADLNGLQGLSKQLNVTACVATQELECVSSIAANGRTENASLGRTVSGRVAAS